MFIRFMRWVAQSCHVSSFDSFYLLFSFSFYSLYQWSHLTISFLLSHISFSSLSSSIFITILNPTNYYCLQEMMPPKQETTSVHVTLSSILAFPNWPLHSHAPPHSLFSLFFFLSLFPRPSLFFSLVLNILLQV